jgi:hypothetical protein
LSTISLFKQFDTSKETVRLAFQPLGKKDTKQLINGVMEQFYASKKSVQLSRANSMRPQRII